MFKEKRAGNDLELLHNYSRGLNLRNMNIGFPITPKNFIYDQDIDRKQGILIILSFATTFTKSYF